jgi:dipeptidyl aminopeptidase/acylaminoacyl peptidase
MRCRYGGPGSQSVSSRWSIDWDHYLSSARDVIVAHVDVRGSGFSGLSMAQAVHLRLGQVEAQDVLHVTRHLVHNLDFVWKNKVCVWGWSFGGFLASRVVQEDAEDTFACAIAVAPVVKWQLYGKLDFDPANRES